MMTAAITRHGIKRVRQRLGLPKKAVEKLVNEAEERGLPPGAYSGQMRRYLDWVVRHKHDAQRASLLVHSGHVFIFRNDVFITAWPLPYHLRHRKAARQRKPSP